MSTKAVLLEQFESYYEENGWFVCLKNATDGVTQLCASENIVKRKS